MDYIIVSILIIFMIIVIIYKIQLWYVMICLIKSYWKEDGLPNIDFKKFFIKMIPFYYLMKRFKNNE